MNTTERFEPELISLSLVSHGHGKLLPPLLEDLARHRPLGGIEVIVTLNTPEPQPFAQAAYPFPLKLLRNPVPQGFAANHNAAFREANGGYFCVLNPDIRLPTDPLPILSAELSDPRVGVAAPLVVDGNGRIEDSARPFPTPSEIGLKALGYVTRRPADHAANLSPDWVGGMFMVFRSATFDEIGGFDPAYRLYYEDVDLCARLRLKGYEVRLSPEARVTHLARRSSHRNPRYALWHMSSMLRFFTARTTRLARSLRRRS